MLFGRCNDESAGPFQPFVEALNGYLTSVDRGHPGNALPVEPRGLERLIPRLNARLDQLPTRTASGPVAPSDDPFDGLAALRCHLAETRPLLVVLDDMQSADKASRLLVRHIVRSLRGVRVMVVLAFRAVEGAASTSLAALLADLRRQQRLDRLALEGLDEDNVSALLRARRAEAADNALPRVVWTKTAGNPFFVVETLRSMREAGRFPGASEVDLDRLGVPAGVKEFVLGQVRTLDRAAVKLLEVASVQGTEFRLQVLERVLGESAERILELIEDVVAAALVAEVPGHVDRFAFRHELVPDTMHEQILASRRLRLHHAVRRALDALDSPSASRPGPFDPGVDATPRQFQQHCPTGM